MLPGSYALDATFSDPDGNGPWSWRVDWGDGASGSGSAAQQGAISGSHLYLSPGSYKVTVSVTDKAGATGSGTLTVTVSLTP